jgi:hypothetical protein
MVDMNSGDMECFFYKLWAKSGLDPLRPLETP